MINARRGPLRKARYVRLVHTMPNAAYIRLFGNRSVFEGHDISLGLQYDGGDGAERTKTKKRQFMILECKQVNRLDIQAMMHAART